MSPDVLLQWVKEEFGKLSSTDVPEAESFGFTRAEINGDRAILLDGLREIAAYARDDLETNGSVPDIESWSKLNLYASDRLKEAIINSQIDHYCSEIKDELFKAECVYIGKKILGHTSLTTPEGINTFIADVIQNLHGEDKEYGQIRSNAFTGYRQILSLKNKIENDGVIY